MIFTIGIICAAFCFHVAHNSFASSWYLFCLSVIVLARLCVLGTAVCIGDSYVYWGQLCVLGTAVSIRKVFFVFYSCELCQVIIIIIIIIIIINIVVVIIVVVTYILFVVVLYLAA